MYWFAMTLPYMRTSDPIYASKMLPRAWQDHSILFFFLQDCNCTMAQAVYIYSIYSSTDAGSREELALICVFRTHQWGDVRELEETENRLCSSVLDQLQELDGMQGKICQEWVAVVQSLRWQDSEWRKMCWIWPDPEVVEENDRLA